MLTTLGDALGILFALDSGMAELVGDDAPELAALEVAVNSMRLDCHKRITSINPACVYLFTDLLGNRGRAVSPLTMPAFIAGELDADLISLEVSTIPSIRLNDSASSDDSIDLARQPRSPRPDSDLLAGR